MFGLTWTGPGAHRIVPSCRIFVPKAVSEHKQPVQLVWIGVRSHCTNPTPPSHDQCGQESLSKPCHLLVKGVRRFVPPSPLQFDRSIEPPLASLSFSHDLLRSCTWSTRSIRCVQIGGERAKDRDKRRRRSSSTKLDGRTLEPPISSAASGAKGTRVGDGFRAKAENGTGASRIQLPEIPSEPFGKGRLSRASLSTPGFSIPTDRERKPKRPRSEGRKFLGPCRPGRDLEPKCEESRYHLVRHR